MFKKSCFLAKMTVKVRADYPKGINLVCITYHSMSASGIFFMLNEDYIFSHSVDHYNKCIHLEKKKDGFIQNICVAEILPLDF